jgi:hypothetical protein
MNASDSNGLGSALNHGAVLFFLSLALLLMAPSVATAATCGAAGQAPCKVWERIPSCDRGLVEDFAKGRCVKPVQERVEPPKPKPLTCGREGQRPCTVTERIPSCDQGLVEDFAQGRCIKRAAATPARPACGSEGQRPCTVTERIPSCDQGLVEDFARGRCVARAPLSCGREGQRPCLVTERIPSCDPALYEDFRENRCRVLPPGKTPWSASFDSMSEGVKALGAVCSSFFNNAASGVVRELHKVPVAFSASPSVAHDATLAASANLRFGTGFLCGVWPHMSGLLQEASFAANSPKMFEATATDAEKKLAAFSRAFNGAYNGHPCSGLSPIGVRPLCALVKALPGEAAGQCMSGLLRKVERELSETGEKGRFNEAKYLNAMELAGNMAYAAALDAVIGAATTGASEAIKPDKLEKIKKVYDFFQDLREAFGALQKAQQGADAMRNELSAIPGCRSLL